MADHSEARERARQEFEEWLGTETCEVHWDESANKNAWYGWLAGRRSLEQERDGAWKDYIMQVWMDPMLTGKKILKALIAGPPVHKGDS